MLIAQNLWQAHYQILSITFPNAFIELKKCETDRIKYQYCNCFIEQTNVKDDLIEYKCLCCNKNYQHKFDEKLKERFINTNKFSNRVFILIIIFMIGKNSMEDCYLKKKIFTVNEIRTILLM